MSVFYSYQNEWIKIGEVWSEGETFCCLLLTMNRWLLVHGIENVYIYMIFAAWYNLIVWFNNFKGWLIYDRQYNWNHTGMSIVILFVES